MTIISKIADFFTGILSTPEFVLQLELLSVRGDLQGVQQVLQTSVGMQPLILQPQYFDRGFTPPKPREWSMWRLVEGQDPELIKSSKAGSPHAYRGFKERDAA